MIPYGLHHIDDDDIHEMVKVLKSDWITTGPKIPEFEQVLADYAGSKYAVAVNSGTSALDIAVGSLHLPAGSEIITTPFSFAATSNSILYNGLKPVFADIEEATRNISPDEIRKRITGKTRAVIFVDFAGHPCHIKEIRELAEEHDLILIDDACHALGAEYHNRRLGSLADLTVFSFHPVKHITTGEGGAVTTDRKDFYDNMLLLRNHGIDRDAKARYGPKSSWAYDMKMLGRNYRMTDFQAALGISQLRKLEKFIEKRTKAASRYNRDLAEISGITIPVTLPGIRHAWHIYTLLLDQTISRDAFFTYLRSQDIGANVHYIPIYRHSYYKKNLPVDPGNYPVTESVFSRIITIPLYPDLTDNEIDYITSAIMSYPPLKQK
jgi:UDP-4-amino-4,6-dideoxy-N-acetyl-beta-L-altrosamine transaminase